MEPVRESKPPKHIKIDDRMASEMMASRQWYHSFELRPGLTTPGKSSFPAKDAADSLKIPGDLEGMRTLDIGAWDGPMTFELERRGAESAALDIQDPEHVGFGVARRILQSNATHYQGSVYQLPHGKLRDLDLVVFRGVYYHLKYPVLAFERIAAAMRLGGTLHFEGEGLIEYAEDLAGRPIDIDFSSLIRSEAPFCLIYPNNYKNSSNWFVPTPKCLESCMIAAGFRVEEMNVFQTNDNATSQRLYGYATKIREAELIEHPLY